MIHSYLIILFSCVFGLNEQPNFVLEHEYEIHAESFTTDQFENIYTISGSEIIKIENQTGKRIKYSNKLFGQISSIDVSDPFRILIFNKDFNKISFVDKKLIELVSPISLDDIDFFEVISVCQSINGGFWIFDKNLIQIIYINKSLNVNQKSSQLSSVMNNTNETIDAFMLEKNDYIYLGIAGEGVLLFNSYGTYIKTFPLKDIDTFQVIDKNIVYSKNGNLIIYNTQNFEKENIDLPVKGFKNVRIENNRIFIQTEDKISVYLVNNYK